ncbi:DUF3592 domain-containing protein [Dyella caseinilytica]|uniref:Rubredoxin-like domain-containing protein n=1 Tax=Dyella caseinilytica TaxID=1849581 RepID=A0ABX7GT90_9GAMM|nr:hypothetical protein [Dyella caseinilytica]QRN52977.1 hypothetical protein ISN74_16250 [Dyella caseinilytica]GGA10372.1 hypothetical protein GCM10011408_34710 [Dyella caseinilytica]
METVCQACGYQRKPTDQVPDWECPSCGKAYAKTSHESPSPLVIYTDNPSAESGNRLHGGASYRSKPKETTFNKHGILIGTLFSLFLIFGIPMLADPSSASAILLHSNVEFVALIFIALMALAGVMRRMSAGVNSDDRKSVFAYSATFFGLIFAVFFFGFAISMHNEARTEAKIQRNGLRTMADVIRIYNGGCGRRSCSFFVEYAFTPSAETNGASKPIHGYADLGDRSNDPRITYARTNKQVPIAYEVDHPEVSALNFNDDVFRLDHGERSRDQMALLGGLFVGILVLVLAVVGLGLWLRPGKK